MELKEVHSSKTFKIGEYAKGGVITVEIKGKFVSIIGKEWDFSTGSRKSSDQSKAEEFCRNEFRLGYGNFMNNSHRQISDYLCDLTTSYYAGEIIKWIEGRVKINRSQSDWDLD